MVDILIGGSAAHPLDYRDGWELQRRLHTEVVSGERADTLVLCEHPSVYTAGRRTAADERPDDGSPVIDVDRGGKITWHGPGQLVGYPIVRLSDPIDVVAYVRDLEGVLIAVLHSLGIDSGRVEGRSGVWIGHEAPGGIGAEKIAAIGIRVAEGVTMHGFALNVSNSLEPYRHIVACGIADAGVTTIERVLGRTVAADEVARLVEMHFAEAFGALGAVSEIAA